MTGTPSEQRRPRRGTTHFNLRFLDGDRSNRARSNVRLVLRDDCLLNPEWTTDHELGPVGHGRGGGFWWQHSSAGLLQQGLYQQYLTTRDSFASMEVN